MKQIYNHIKKRTYSDGRIRYIMHEYQKAQKPPYQGKFKKEKMDPDIIKNMTGKCYKRLLKTNFKKLYAREFNVSNCLFITLTFEDKLDIETVNLKFKQFIKKLRIHFGKLQYMRRLAVHKDNTRFHIHSVIEFDIVPKAYKKSISDLWDLGTCCVKKIKHMKKDIYSLFGYILKYEKQVLKKYYPDYTVLPKKAKIVTISAKFGKISTFKDEPISYDEYIEDMQNISLISKYSDTLIRIDKHYYCKPKMNFNDTLQKLHAEYLDNVYIISSALTFNYY